MKCSINLNTANLGPFESSAWCASFLGEKVHPCSHSVWHFQYYPPHQYSYNTICKRHIIYKQQVLERSVLYSLLLAHNSVTPMANKHYVPRSNHSPFTIYLKRAMKKCFCMFHSHQHVWSFHRLKDTFESLKMWHTILCLGPT